MKFILKLWIFITRYIFKTLTFDIINDIEKCIIDIYDISTKIKSDGLDPDKINILKNIKLFDKYYLPKKYYNEDIYDLYIKDISKTNFIIDILLYYYTIYCNSQENVFYICEEYDRYVRKYKKYLNESFNAILNKENGLIIDEYVIFLNIVKAYEVKWYGEYDFKKEIDTDIKMFIETNNLPQYTYLIGYELE